MPKGRGLQRCRFGYRCGVKTAVKIALGIAVVAALAIGTVRFFGTPQTAVPFATAVTPAETADAAKASPSPTASPSPSVAPSPGPVAPVVINHGPREDMKVAMTFDADLSESSQQRVLDGRFPPQYNEEVVNYLEANEVPAMMFVTGMWAQQYPDAMARFAKSPLFSIGNHSWNHLAWTSDCYGLPTVSDSQAKAEQVQATNQVIFEMSGTWPRYFRFPGLCHNPGDVDIVANAGLYTVDTDVPVSDAFASNASLVAREMLANVQPGSILVFHLNGAPNAPATAGIITQLVPALRQAGYEIVSLDELLADLPVAQVAS